MPTSPDRTWTQILTDLDDNNSGSITEERVRSLGRFAKTSYATASACAAATPTGAWAGTIPVDLSVIDPAVTMPRYFKLMSAINTGPYTVFKHAGGDYLSVDSVGFNYTGGSGADVVAASRLVMFSWDIELYQETLESCAIGWYFLPAGSTWPTNAKRHRIGRMYSQLGWQDLSAPDTTPFTNEFNRDGGGLGYVMTSTGTGSIILSPGDKLIPLFEHYGPSGVLSNTTMNFDITAYTAGVVDAWTPATQYWDSVSYAKSTPPYEYPTVARLLGPPTT